jgi:hypothetical protein
MSMALRASKIFGLRFVSPLEIHPNLNALLLKAVYQNIDYP